MCVLLQATGATSIKAGGLDVEAGGLNVGSGGVAVSSGGLTVDGGFVLRSGTLVIEDAGSDTGGGGGGFEVMFPVYNTTLHTSSDGCVDGGELPNKLQAFSSISSSPSLCLSLSLRVYRSTRLRCTVATRILVLLARAPLFGQKFPLLHSRPQTMHMRAFRSGHRNLSH